MAWWIKEWSRELGRGRIEGTRSDGLDFDASVALVDDFRIGEEVRVELERRGDGWRVTRIEPDDPRFQAREPVAAGAPALDEALQRVVQATLDRVQLQETYRPSSLAEGRLVLHGEEGYVYPPPGDEIVFAGLRYAEVADPIQIKSLRLARPSERDYLATRVDGFSSEDIAVTLVDTDRRFYFVVCESVYYRRSR